MKLGKIPKYYTDPNLSEEEKHQKDLEMIANDFAL